MTIGPSGKAWKAHVRKAVEQIDKALPGGSAGTYPGHDPSESLAADFMCNRALGDKISAYARTHAKGLGIWYVIWWGRIWSMTRPEEGWLRYFDADNPNPSRSHHNHVHISWYKAAPKQVTMWAVRTVKGYEAPPSSKVLYTRPKGFKLVGYIGARSDGKYLVTVHNTWYPLDDLSEKNPTPKPPPKPKPDPVTYTMLSLNTLLPLFADDTAEPWHIRAPKLAEIIHGTKTGIVAAQECGAVESLELAAALGVSWQYQRATNNCVFWDSAVWEQADDVRQWDLPSGGQMQRTLITVKLRNLRTKAYIWASSTHLAASAFDLPSADAIELRKVQAKVIGDTLLAYSWIILGADLNSPDEPDQPRAILRGLGWKMLADQVTVTGIAQASKTGLDEVAVKSGAKVTAASVVETGTASDHDGRLVTFTIQGTQTK